MFRLVDLYVKLQADREMTCRSSGTGMLSLRAAVDARKWHDASALMRACPWSVIDRN